MIDSNGTRSGARWPTTTIWDRLAAVGSIAERTHTIEEIANKYWRPVYAYLRKHGRSHHDSADLTQDFFTALLSRDWVRRADEKKGKFRVFLVTLLARYVKDLENKAQERFEKKAARISLGASAADSALLDWKETESPSHAYWLQYVRDLLDRSLEVFEKETGEGDTLGHDIFMLKLKSGVEGGPVSWEKVSTSFGVSIDQARWAYSRALRRFKAVLARNLGAEGERESEFRWAVAEMFKIVSGPWSGTANRNSD